MSHSLPASIVAPRNALGQALVQQAQQQHGQPLAALEPGVRHAVQAAMPGLLQAVVALATPDLDRGLATVTRRCPTCTHPVRLHRSRPRTLHTSYGGVTVWRPWYHCPTCRHGFRPVAATLGVAPRARISTAVEGWLVRLTVTTTQREATALLTEVTGVVVDMDSMREHTTAVGTAVAVAVAEDAAMAQVQATQEPAAPLDPAPGTRVVELDGAMVR